MSIRVLVNGQIPGEGLNLLADRFSIDYYKRLGDPDVLAAIGDYDALICLFSEEFPSGLIGRAKNLKIISNYGVGYNNIPVEQASLNNILVTNTPGSVTEPTAELAMGILISLARRIPELDSRLRKEKFGWGLLDNLGTGLYGKTLGIIGYGRIGKAMARRGLAMGMKITYYSRTRLTAPAEREQQVEYSAFENLLEQSDFVSLHVPYTRETHHMIGKEQLALMKEGSLLVNTARGSVVDEQELIKTLESGHLGGAGLDVYENEPLVSEQLLTLKNVVLTPHIGTASYEGRIAIAEEAAESIIDFFSAKKPVNIINIEVWK